LNFVFEYFLKAFECRLQGLHFLEPYAHAFEVAWTILVHFIIPSIEFVREFVFLPLSFNLELIVLNKSSLSKLVVEFYDLFEDLLIVLSVQFGHFIHNAFDLCNHLLAGS